MTFLLIVLLAAFVLWTNSQLRALRRRLDEIESTFSGDFARSPGSSAAALSASAVDEPAEARARPEEPTVRELTPAVESLPDANPARLSGLREGLAWLRRAASDTDWESIVGANWLNKLGVLVLVIGIALFLGYSLTRIGAMGRVGVGLVASLAMLAGGQILDGRDRYRIFGRGLLGGGWAALYFTAYAAHGLTAARVIESPFVASALLLAVAAGMIVHSLRYRSEVATALAYFVAFFALDISEVTGFAPVAAVPLAASMVVLARRLRWEFIAVAGLIATYATYLIAPAPPPELRSLLYGQALLSVYWLMFEAIDLDRARTR